ncbi:MAG: hypothetical protein PHV32_15560, partial [Eubacteriales bacterium]|nr:hypothetical protein [Eubacteriales bacterium]
MKNKIRSPSLCKDTLDNTWNIGGAAMNFFENELRRLLDNDGSISEKRFVGRACFMKVSDKLR